MLSRCLSLSDSRVSVSLQSREKGEGVCMSVGTKTRGLISYLNIAILWEYLPH